MLLFVQDVEDVSPRAVRRATSMTSTAVAMDAKTEDELERRIENGEALGKENGSEDNQAEWRKNATNEFEEASNRRRIEGNIKKTTTKRESILLTNNYVNAVFKNINFCAVLQNE